MNNITDPIDPIDPQGENPNPQIPESLTAKHKVPARESISYGIYFLGQNIIYWLITNWLLYFYTEEALITPAAVTVIFLIAKVWDAVNDPIFGIIIDKTKFKKAKFTPWIKASSFLLPLSTILVFSIPSGLPMLAKIGLAFLTYAIWDILYTVSDAPAFALATVMTDDVKKRSALVNYGRIGAMVGVILITLLAPLVVDRSGVTFTAIILSALAVITMIPLGFVAKERAAIPEELEGESDHTIGEMIRYLKGNRYLLVFFGAFLIHGIFKVTLGNYVAEHLMGSLAINSIVGMFALPAMVLVYIVIPIFTKRRDKMSLYKFSIFAAVVISVIQYFAGYSNLTIYIVVSVLRAFVEGLAGALMFTFSADAVEYGHYKTGTRKEGVTFSVQTFSAKFTAALAGVVTSLVLTLIGYQGGVAVTAGMASWIWAANCLLPGLGALLSLPVLLKYNLKDADVQVMTNINNGEITREEGEKLLTQKYL